MKKALFILACAAATVAGPSAAANLLVNGSFESGSFLPGWSLSGTSGDGDNPVVIAYNQGSGYPGGAFGEPIPTDDIVGGSPDAAGNYAAYFVGDFDSRVMSQNFAVVAGQAYTGGFDYYIPLNGSMNPNDAVLTVSVSGMTFLTLNASSVTPQDWLHFEASGVAPVSGIATVSFGFATNGNPAKDFVLDRIFISAVPEPASWAMMIGGFGLVGGALRRRTSRAVVA